LVSTQYLVRTLRFARMPNIAAHARSPAVPILDIPVLDVPVLIGQVDAALSELRRATKRRKGGCGQLCDNL